MQAVSKLSTFTSVIYGGKINRIIVPVSAAVYLSAATVNYARKMFIKQAHGLGDVAASTCLIKNRSW